MGIAQALVLLFASSANGDVYDKQFASPTNLPLISIPTEVPPAQVPTVHISVFMSNIDRINGRDGEWIGDATVTFKYRVKDWPITMRGCKGDASICQVATPAVEVINGKIREVNEARRISDGEYIWVTKRLFIDMVFDGDYHLFPFDEQDLNFDVCIKGLSVDDVRVVQDPEISSGIRALDSRGRHFKEAQFRLVYWQLSIGPHTPSGFSYEKSRARLQIRMRRYLPYYALSCMVLPILALIFAKAAFALPPTNIMPRVMISFVAFLATFAHIKWVMSFTPPGVWCWLFSEMTFFATILTVAVLMNIVSAVAQLHNPFLANRHDHVLKFVLPLEFFTGIILLVLLKDYHIIINLVLVPTVTIYHLLCAHFIAVEARRLGSKGDDVDPCVKLLLCGCFNPWNAYSGRDLLMTDEYFKEEGDDDAEGDADAEAGDDGGDAGI